MKKVAAGIILVVALCGGMARAQHWGGETKYTGFSIVGAARTLDLETNNFSYVNVGTGTAATINLPTTVSAHADRVYVVFHNNSTVTTSINPGSFSINGSAADMELDAAGDIAIIIGTGAGWTGMVSSH